MHWPRHILFSLAPVIGLLSMLGALGTLGALGISGARAGADDLAYISCADALDKTRESSVPANYFRLERSGKIGFGRGGSARVYPEALTLENLGLTKMAIAQLRGRIVLVGEGYGHLLPLLVNRPEVTVTAVDPIYGSDLPAGFMGDALRDFTARYAGHLDASSSAGLPMASESVDFLFSHYLINNFLEQSPGSTEEKPHFQFSEIGLRTMTEAIRVLNVGGTAVFAAAMTTGRATELLEDAAKLLEPAARGSYSIKLESFDRETDYTTFGHLAPDIQYLKPKVSYSVVRITIGRTASSISAAATAHARPITGVISVRSDK